MNTATLSDRLSELIDRQAWSDVAMQLSDRSDPGDVWLCTLARNLVSMQIHRVALYSTVIEAMGSFAFDAVDVRFGPEQSDVRAHEIFGATQLLRQAGRSVALAGISDGRVLRAHARFAPSLILGRQQEVVVIEPDLARLIAGLGFADLTGPRGGFEQRRISWYVGPNWVDHLAADLIEQPTRVPPIRAEPTSVERSEIDAGMEEIDRRVRLALEDRRAMVNAYYESFDDLELLDVLGPTPHRKPRVLMLTSQFSSVLQYSTSDSAHAMRELGWEVEICTEQEMWHSTSTSALLASIAQFKPDLVFQIDHLRYETKDLIPSNLPFVCWIQDHLTNLTNDFAGNSITDRDFVLTGGTYRYVDRYSYPRRQCIDMPKCSRPPELPRQWSCEREDLFYVSHWSYTPEAITSEICSRIKDLAGPIAEQAMRESCAEMIRAYGRGESYRTDLEVRTMVRSVFARLVFTCEQKTEQFFVDVLFQRLNQVFYRQQSLTWAAEISEELGLKFGIYGKGWEMHPTLGRYARGVVKYGPDLESLTRESKILLQIEPYACYTHQRMLDALLAGGFALIRAHPLNHLPIKIRQFLDAFVPPEINSVSEAMETLSPPLREQFSELLDESEIISAMGDVVDVVRGWQRAGTIGNADEVLPHLNEIAFDSRDSLRERVRHFLADDSSRRNVAAAQRECVLERLTYSKALGGAMRKIHELLAESIAAKSESSAILEAA